MQKLALTSGEEKFCAGIRVKDKALRNYLASNSLSDPTSISQWLLYLTQVKNTLGNLNNDVSFVATVLIKEYLFRRFEIGNFDASGKPQGAPGIDIECRTKNGQRIVGELKTTKPYQPGFGAAQRTNILKDLARLVSTPADYRFMFVTDADAYRALCEKRFSSMAIGIEIVDLVSGEHFLCSRI